MNSITIAIIAATLSACAPTTSEGLKTPSTIYNAKYASDRKATQAQVNVCVKEGIDAQNNDTSEFRNVKAGKAYEACIDRVTKK